jgi:hypothetical protein
MRALASSSRKGFLEQLLQHLRGAFPEQLARHDDVALRAAIADVVDRAHGIGFSTERELASVAEYVLVFGLDLDGEGAQEVIRAWWFPAGIKLLALEALAVRAHEGGRGLAERGEGP